MTNYLIRRLFQMFLVVIAASFMIYALLWLSPGGPLDELKMAGAQDRRNRLTPQQMEDIAEYLGVHRGMIWGYLAWLVGEDWMGQVPPSIVNALLWPPSEISTGEQVLLQRPVCREDPAFCGHGVLRLDFGKTFQIARGSTVIDVLQSRLGNTLILMVAASLLSLLVALPIGIFSAVKQYSRLDYVVTTFSFFGTSMPVFWFALMMIQAFGGNQSIIYKTFNLPYLPPANVTLVRAPLPGSLLDVLGATPGSWLDIAVHAILPTIVLSLLYMAGWSRFMRSAMLEVLRQDYVRTARAKGLIERVVILKHALRNSLIPLITIVVFQIPGVFGGAIITESVFNWQGTGQLYLLALAAYDYPVAMALLFITSILVVVATLLGDILYTTVDPRIRFS
jgi:peptide/nickel transport system permease protein